MKQAWKSKSYEIIPGYELPTLWYEMNTGNYEFSHVVWNKMHRVWSSFGMVWNEKKWDVIIPHMEMRIISYRLYTISYQIWYEFFACFFLMVVDQWLSSMSVRWLYHRLRRKLWCITSHAERCAQCAPGTSGNAGETSSPEYASA